ncbi:MAG: acetolactate synthase large subunit [Ahrensia sp.]
MRAADYMVACLEANGVERIYGVPGEENADLMLALKSSSIDFVMTRHEQAAAAMAAAAGRLTGSPGICLATLGPGASNLATGLGTAHLDFCPVIAITGQGATSRMHKESHQLVDTGTMLKPVCKWTATITAPEMIGEIVSQAFGEALGEKPGVAHIVLPEDVAGQDISAELQPIPHQPFEAPIAQTKGIESAVELLENARHPIALIGAEAVRSNAGNALRSLSGVTQLHVATTMMAKGIIDEHSPSSLSTFGVPEDDPLQDALDRADLIMAIGVDPVEYPASKWNNDTNRPLIHVSAHPAQLERAYQPCLQIVGDIDASIQSMTLMLAEQGLNLHSSMLAEMRTAIHAAKKPTAGDTARSPRAIIQSLNETLGADDILFVGVGAHKMWMARCFAAQNPAACLITNGYTSMGVALPGAIAAAQLNPDKRVYALCGDGDFMMNVQEMETAKRLGANLTVIGWFDDAYSLIEHKQDKEHDSHSDLRVDNPDWCALAQSFGWAHIGVDDATPLSDALRDAAQQQGPVLISVPVDQSDNTAL